MLLDYKPDGGEVTRFEFRPGKVRASRAAMIERLYTKLAGETRTWEMFKADILRGSMVARRVLLWHFLSGKHPTVRIEDVDPLEDEMVLQFSKAELEDFYAAAEKSTSGTEDEREMILARLREEIEAAPDGDDEGKGSSATSPTTD